MDDLVGRKFRFERHGNKLVPVKELPSATWFHPDGSITMQAVEDIYAGAPVAVNSQGLIVPVIKMREDS